MSNSIFRFVQINMKHLLYLSRVKNPDHKAETGFSIYYSHWYSMVYYVTNKTYRSNEMYYLYLSKRPKMLKSRAQEQVIQTYLSVI